MKQKPDERLDQWVRQSLDHLPDAPPPGSSFDPEQLWAQLRPELQAEPVRRRIGLAWWLAAACLAGLAVGWFWLQQLADDGKAVVTHGKNYKNHKASEPTVNAAKPNSTDHIAMVKPDFSEKRRASARPLAAYYQKESPKDKSTSPVIEAPEENPKTPELPIVAELPPVVIKSPELPKPNVATVTPKRRFRVMHENELRAEEEARPKLYRTEHFVRLGTGRNETSVSEDRHPTLIMSLPNKPNH